jgi:hypothetical protein
MADTSKYLEYDSNSDDLVHHHNKPQFMTGENKWLLKYQHFFQFYLTYRHCEVPIKTEMETLAIGFCIKELKSNLILTLLIPTALHYTG